jgi:peptidoglycan-associated lipoprotein
VKKTFISLLLALLLTACVSGVKLNEVPVENKKGSDASVNSLANQNISVGPADIEKIVYFDYNSYSIKPEFHETIKAHAQFLKANSSTKLSLEGHTDKVITSLEYSLSLGQKRADAVRQSLYLLGVNGTQIEAVSFGVEKPAVQGNDESAFSKNRRVEFFYK